MHNELKIGTKCKNVKIWKVCSLLIFLVMFSHFVGPLLRDIKYFFLNVIFWLWGKQCTVPKWHFFLSFSLLCYVKNIMTKLLLIWWLMILFFYRKVKWQQNWIDLTMRCCCHHHFLQCYFVIDYMHTSPTYLLQHCLQPKYKELYTVLKARISKTQTQIRKNQISNRNWEPIRTT